MLDNSKRYNIWTIQAPSSSYEKHFEYHPEHIKYLPEFEADVTTNPLYNPKHKKIARIQSEVNRYPEGCYRWSKSDLRIVYLPEKTGHKIYPLDADTAGGIRYKKRS